MLGLRRVVVDAEAGTRKRKFIKVRAPFVRLSGSKRTANAVHPGVVRTNLDRNNLLGRILYRLAGPILVKNVAEGAATQIFVATHPAVATESGKYFADCMIAPSRPDTGDQALAKRLWEVSEEIAQLV